MSASNRFNSRRRFSRLVAGVGLLGLAVAALGVGYSQTPKQSEPLTTKGQLTLAYDQAGKVVYQITLDGSHALVNAVKLLVASPEICQRIGLLIPFGISKYNPYYRQFTEADELRMFNLDRVFEKAMLDWQKTGISKNMLGINYTKLSVCDLKDFRRLANGETLEPKTLQIAILAAQRAFTMIRTLKNATNPDKKNPIMGAFESLAQINAKSHWHEVVGGVFFCPRYAVGFHMDCKTDEEFIKNFTISCEDEEIKQSAGQEILDLINQIGGISLPRNYLEEQTIVGVGQIFSMSEADVEKMKSDEFCDAINKLIQILDMCLVQPLVGNDQNGQGRPIGFDSESTSVKFKFFQSMPEMKKSIFEMAASRRELFLKCQTYPTPHVPFKPDKQQCQAHINQDSWLVKTVIERARELQGSFRIHKS